MPHVGSVKSTEAVYLFIAQDGNYSITHKTGCFFASSLCNCTVNCIAPLLHSPTRNLLTQSLPPKVLGLPEDIINRPRRYFFFSVVCIITEHKKKLTVIFSCVRIYQFLGCNSRAFYWSSGILTYIKWDPAARFELTEHVQKMFFHERCDKLSVERSSHSYAAVSKLHAHDAVAVLPPEYVTGSVFPSNAVFTILFYEELLLSTYSCFSS